MCAYTRTQCEHECVHWLHFCEKVIIIVVIFIAGTQQKKIIWNEMRKNIMLLPDCLDADTADAASNSIRLIQCWSFWTSFFGMYARICTEKKTQQLSYSISELISKWDVHIASSIAFKITWIEQQSSSNRVAIGY